MDFTRMTLKERANHCLNIYQEDVKSTPKCADNFISNEQCGSICCGHCREYSNCKENKCRQVWIDPRLVMENPTGRVIYVVLETGRLVSGSVPCIISESYDDNE